MEWWNDIWLNEGFAKYMEFISVEATYPDLRIVRVYADSGFKCFTLIQRAVKNFSHARYNRMNTCWKRVLLHLVTIR